MIDRPDALRTCANTPEDQTGVRTRAARSRRLTVRHYSLLLVQADW
jgi:hypothetical protein